MEDEVPLSGVAKRGGVAVAGNTEDGVRRAGDAGGTGQYSSQSYPSAGERTGLSIASEDSAVSQGEVILSLAAGSLGIAEAVLEAAPVGARLLLCDGGRRHGGASEALYRAARGGLRCFPRVGRRETVGLRVLSRIDPKTCR